MKLILDGVKKNFEKKEVLKDASFAFEEGKIYGLLGRNGAGKTTLFNCINEDLKTDGGTIMLEKDGVTAKPTMDDIGYVLSTPVVPEFLTAREFLKFYIEINSAVITSPKTLDEYFEMVLLEEADRDKLLKDYSHGMKNKMQMLVNFVSKPAVLLLDEPLTSFDVVVAEDMKRLLRHQKESEIIIFSTHILELAVDLCDEIVILNDGVLEAVDMTALDDADLKARIIAALKGDENA